MKKLLSFIVIILIMLGFTAIILVNMKGSDEQNNSKESGNMKEKVSDGLHFSLYEVNMGKDIDEKKRNFKYVVTNESDKKQKLSFSTSQQYEFEISNEQGVVYKYSDGRAFMQVLKEVALSPGEDLSFDIATPELDDGEYTLTIYLVAKNRAKSSKLSVKFTVNN